jgi:hypothetical protein
MAIDALWTKRYWSEAEGRRAAGLWRKSGLPIAVFAARVGVSRGRLQYWISERDGRPAGGAAIELTPVAVVSRSTPSAISIELRSGRCVQIDGDFDDALLERVIVIAERAGC